MNRRIALCVLLCGFAASCANTNGSDHRETLAQHEAENAFDLGLVAMEQQDYAMAVTHFDRSLAIGQLSMDDLSAIHIDRALSLIHQDKCAEAIADFDAALKVMPDPIALTGRGACRAEAKRYDLAAADFAAAIDIDPSCAEAYASRGDLRQIAGDYENAIADYTKAIELKPYLIEPYIGRGNAYGAMHRPALAIADFDVALRRQPDSNEAIEAKAKTLTELGYPIK